MAQASEARVIVMNAVEQAFLDALARRSGVPLATLLGGLERRTIPAYANINRGISDRSPAGFAARARDVVTEEGYNAVKIAPFDGLNWAQWDHATGSRLIGTGIDRIAAVRDAIGPEASLLVAYHARLSPLMARTVLREAGPGGLFWLEVPLANDAFDVGTGRALRSFANDRGIRIAGGEHLTTMAQARDFLGGGICDAILPDLRLTGIRTGLAVLELAAASGVEVSLHNPVGPGRNSSRMVRSCSTRHLASVCLRTGQRWNAAPTMASMPRRAWPASVVQEAMHDDPDANSSDSTALRVVAVVAPTFGSNALPVAAPTRTYPADR